VLIDINVLVAAYRADHPQHAVAAKWLREKIDASPSVPELLITVSIASGFLRLVTNARIFAVPASSADGVEFLDWLLDSGAAAFLKSGDEWAAFRTLVLDHALAVNAIPDAHLAALAMSHSEPFVTFDKGFRKLLPRSLLVLLPSE
jgi:uncharacterized protein